MPQEVLKDDVIIKFTPGTLFSPQVLDELYDIDDELEQARLKSLLMIRAKELNIEKEFTSIIRAYDKANRRLADEYTRQNAVNNAEIPLKMDNKGRPVETIDNFLLILRNDDIFDDIKFNLLSNTPERHEKNGNIKSWEDTDDSELRNYIENKYKLYSPTKLDDALRILFKERSYHPIKNIIESAAWDGIERIPTLLTKWLKCEDNAYTREVSRLIFAGGINRLYRPGCKFDDVPILIGTKQGEGKTTFVRWLAIKDIFFKEVSEIEGQKGIESIRGAWICELSELLAMTRTKDVESVKSYITRMVDSYRQPYDKRPSEYKRQCIFIGTTNKEQFLTDKTGNRRFYPVKVNQSGYDLFNHEAEIKSNILQCWAEAKLKFDKGEMLPYADKNMLHTIREYQSNAVEDDYRIGMIESYLENKEEVCILELWQNALRNEFSKPTKRDSNDVALILQAFSDWERLEKPKRTRDFGLQKVWIKKPDSERNIISQTEITDLPFG